MNRAIVALSVSGCVCAAAGFASGGVVHRVVLEGEIIEVGPITPSVFEDLDITLRSNERWSMEVLLDASMPDVRGPDRTKFGNSIISASLMLDGHGMPLDFGSVNNGIVISSGASGRVSFDAMLMGTMGVSVFAEGVGASPADGLPAHVDLGMASRARFEITDSSGAMIVIGSFDGYGFETILPAPGTAALFVSGGVLASRRRR